MTTQTNTFAGKHESLSPTGSDTPETNLQAYT